MNSVDDIFEYLTGQWLFEKQVTMEEDNNFFGMASGQASFRMTGQYMMQLEYSERPENKFKCLQDHPEFFYSYLYSRTYGEKEDQINVNHLDGRHTGFLFQCYFFDKNKHELSERAPLACGQDAFSGLYEFQNENHFILHTVMQMENPKGKYLIETAYIRQP